jgi:hypothetical protein
MERAARLIGKLRARPFDALLGVLVVGLALYVVAYPFFVASLPLVTDLPFHATAISILRHYWDPSFRFHEQFTIHPIEVPYISMYVLGALFALVMPVVAATKASAIVMLALLPIGLGVLFHGMKKTPLWGVLGLALVWTNLTWWGFLNHVGALGLYAMSVGFALMVVDRPTRARRWGLALSLLAVFFTHIFRFPFALLSVIGAAVLVYPATRRIRPLLLPLVPSVLAFGAWLLVRPKAGPMPTEPLRLQPQRLGEIWSHVTMSFAGESGMREQALFEDAKSAIAVVAMTAAIWFFWARRKRSYGAREVWWGISVTLLPLLLAGGFLFAYLLLPMRIGIWWYVYPREITSALFIALAAVPDMPRVWWLKLPLVAVLGVFLGRIGYFAAIESWKFDTATRDFRQVAAEVSKAPKLLYLVFDHSGSTRRVTPFIHLPAWVQAAKGGALSFQFVGWDQSPIRYRKNAPEAVPPPVPDRWEWTPERYRHAEHGKWFNEFLIRSRRDPAYLFQSDPSIELVAHDGTWWLYRRRASP